MSSWWKIVAQYVDSQCGNSAVSRSPRVASLLETFRFTFVLLNSINSEAPVTRDWTSGRNGTVYAASCIVLCGILSPIPPKHVTRPATPPFPGFDRLGVRLGWKHQPKIGSNYPFWNPGNVLLVEFPVTHWPSSGKYFRYLNTLVHLNTFKVDKVNFILELHLKICYCK